MPQINQLSALSQVSPGDQVPVYSPSNGDARRMSVSQLLQYFQDTFVSPTTEVTLYSPAVPTTINAPTPDSEQIWMLLQPTGTLANLTIALPAAAITPDGTEILVTTTQELTVFNMTSAGAAAVVGFPTKMGAGAATRMKFYAATNSWYNVLKNSDVGAATGTSLALTGALSAGATTLSGALGGTSATFSGSLQAGATTLTGAFNGTSATLTGTLGGTSATFSGQATANPILSASASAPMGYTTGAGGTVSQGPTGKASTVTLDKTCGVITLDASVNGTINAGATVSFLFNNSAISSNDVVIVSPVTNAPEAQSYSAFVQRVSSGSCVIGVTNITGAPLTTALAINFAVINVSST